MVGTYTAVLPYGNQALAITLLRLGLLSLIANIKHIKSTKAPQTSKSAIISQSLKVLNLALGFFHPLLSFLQLLYIEKGNCLPGVLI